MNFLEIGSTDSRVTINHHPHLPQSPSRNLHHLLHLNPNHSLNPNQSLSHSHNHRHNLNLNPGLKLNRKQNMNRSPNQSLIAKSRSKVNTSGKAPTSSGRKKSNQSTRSGKKKRPRNITILSPNSNRSPTRNPKLLLLLSILTMTTLSSR